MLPQNVFYLLFDLPSLPIVYESRRHGWLREARKNRNPDSTSEQKSFPRAGLKSQLGSEFHGTVAANGAGDVAETNGITGVSVWLIKLWSIGCAECFRAKLQANSLSYRE